MGTTVSGDNCQGGQLSVGQLSVDHGQLSEETVSALKKLSSDRHPHDDKDLATAPRRMTVDDVGVAPKEQGSWSEGSITGCERPVPPPPITQGVESFDPLSEEDPFGFGFGIDKA